MGLAGRERTGGDLRTRLLAALLTVALLAAAYVGRAVVSIDAAEIVSVTLGFLVLGRFEAAMIPTQELLPQLAFQSHYGLFPSLVPLPFLAPAWPFRAALGPRGLDAVVALTWAVGCLLASAGFLSLVRRLRPGASPLWLPAFLGGTFLWPYAADSFFDPWSAAFFAFGSARILAGDEGRPRVRAAILAGLLWSCGCWLRPLLWITAPGFLLAGLLRWRRAANGAACGTGLAAALLAGVGVALSVNAVYHGNPLHFGYELRPDLPFSGSLLAGFVGLTVSPGRGVFLYAPLAIVALLALRRLSPALLVLCFGIPTILILVVARWYVWFGGSCWGPRYLIPVLPLLIAPAVLGTRRLAVVATVVGGVVNSSGVLVAPGAWISYAELLKPPASAGWPVAGGDRVSTIPSLTPLYGHAWLLAESVLPGTLPAPWLSAGAVETAKRPGPAEFISPWVVRRLAGLRDIYPFVPRLLLRVSIAYVMRDRPVEAVRFARIVLQISPGDADAEAIVRNEGRR